MNDCPRQNPAYRSASLFIKPRFGGVFAFWAGWMNDCPRRYAQKNAAYRSASLFIKPRFGGFFAVWAGCHAWWRYAYQAYWDGWNWFGRPDKVFTPPSGKYFPDSIAIGLPRIWRFIFHSSNLYLVLIYVAGFFYKRKCLSGYFLFCDGQHKTLCDTFFPRIITRNRSLSQN